MREAFKRARIRAGYSQEGLAHAAGVSRQTVYNIERGDTEPRLELALTLAKLLDADPAKLFKVAA